MKRRDGNERVESTGRGTEWRRVRRGRVDMKKCGRVRGVEQREESIEEAILSKIGEVEEKLNSLSPLSKLSPHTLLPLPLLCGGTERQGGRVEGCER